MERILLLFLFISTIDVFSQNAKCDWVKSFPKDSMILGYTVNSKDEVICIGINKEEELFSVIYDPAGKLVSENTFQLLEDDACIGTEDDEIHEKMLCSKNDKVYFVGCMEDRRLEITNYKTGSDKRDESDFVFIAELDKKGKLKELHPIISYVYGVDISITGIVIGEQEEIVIALQAEPDLNKEPDEDEYALTIGTRKFVLGEADFKEFVIRIGKGSIVEWVKCIDVDQSALGSKANGSDDMLFKSLALDAEGNSYRLLNFRGKAMAEGKEIFLRPAKEQVKDLGTVIKYSAEGNLLWAKSYGSVSGILDITSCGNNLMLVGIFESDFSQDGFSFVNKPPSEDMAMFSISQVNGKIMGMSADTSSFSVKGDYNTMDKKFYALGDNKVFSLDRKMKPLKAFPWWGDNPGFRIFNGKAYMMLDCKRNWNEVDLAGKKYWSRENKRFFAKISFPVKK